MRVVRIVLACALSVNAAELRVGSATVKITPPKFSAMPGYYYNRSADGVHDDLFAKALVFESNGEKAGVVTGEIFAELGMAIKDASPFQFTTVVELPNGSIGCVPNLRA